MYVQGTASISFNIWSLEDYEINSGPVGIEFKLDFDQTNWTELLPVGTYALNNAMKDSERETPENFVALGTQQNKDGIYHQLMKKLMKVYHYNIGLELYWNKNQQ